MKGYKMTKTELQTEALSRAVTGQTMSNYMTIINGFSAKGIPGNQIKPRENVFTYNAWKALGRQVKKGEHGVKITTFRHDKREIEKSDGTKEERISSRPWFATVFHVSQTEAITKQ